jgi:ASC-1-like (ASCH) protein
MTFLQRRVCAYHSLLRGAPSIVRGATTLRLGILMAEESLHKILCNQSLLDCKLMGYIEIYVSWVENLYARITHSLLA